MLFFLILTFVFDKAFAALRKKVEAEPSMKGFPLEAQLIKPVQRVCRYPLLLGELKRRTGQGFFFLLFFAVVGFYFLTFCCL